MRKFYFKAALQSKKKKNVLGAGSKFTMTGTKENEKERLIIVIDDDIGKVYPQRRKKTDTSKNEQIRHEYPSSTTPRI